MIVPTPLDVKLKLAAPFVREVADRVQPILRQYLESTGYAFISRIKELTSLAEKIETGRYAAWSEVDDLFACAIIIPTLEEEPAVLSFLRSHFREIIVRRRGMAMKDPASFRFDATRFIGTLRPTLSPEPPDALSRQRFEIQVRTAFEHAWSVATHDLVYKGAQVDWRRLRLLAHLKASTEQLDHLIVGFDKVSELIGQEEWPEVEAKRTIENAFKEWVDSGAIPPECKPASWVRFAENVYALIRGAFGGRRVTVEHVNSILELVAEAVSEQSGARFPRSISLTQFTIGAIADAGLIKKPLTNYCPLLTEALFSIFPATREIGQSFDFELA